jgi:hypothetical protein
MLARPRFTARRFDGNLSEAMRRESTMRHLVIAIVMAACASLIGTAAVSAAPANGKAIAQAADHASYVTDVAGGCGYGWHRNRWGRCVP